MEDEKILGYVGDGNSVKGSHLTDDGSWELAVDVTDPDLWERIKAAHARVPDLKLGKLSR